MASALNILMDTNHDPSAEDLLGAARSGDQSARGRLFGMYENYMTLLVRMQVGRRLQGKVDPADVVQETFLHAHRDFEMFRGQTEAELLGWLRRILAAVVAVQVRRYFGTKRRDLRLERDLADELDHSSRILDVALVAQGSSPSQQASRREQAVLLADALATLPEHYREVLMLRHIEELSFPDVAERMQRSLDSVKKLWIRGLSQLRSALESTDGRNQ
jgi:RNA polymerase sigma-70 factor (ECF subfamily)